MVKPGCSLCFGKVRAFDKKHPRSQCWSCSSQVCRKCIQIMELVVPYCPICHREPEDPKPILVASSRF